MSRRLARSAAVAAATTLMIAPGWVGASASDVHTNIVGGHEATGETGWMASLQYDAPSFGVYDWHTCGGTLAVSRRTVVTNAHCVTDMPEATTADTRAQLATRFHVDAKTTALAIPIKAKNFKVRLGSKNRTSGGELVDVVGITVESGWNWGMNPDPKVPVADIAVLHLAHDVDQQPLQLASSEAKRGDRITLYGWGIDNPGSGTEPNPTLPTRLQQLETRVVPAASCADAGISAKEICTGNVDGWAGPCYGDSGGPAVKVVDGLPKLVGGASRLSSQYCGDAASVYTSTPGFTQWIVKTVRGGPPPANPVTIQHAAYTLPYERGDGSATGGVPTGFGGGHTRPVVVPQGHKLVSTGI